MLFSSNIACENRASRMDYVYDKYKDILTKTVLDVGADECHLKKLLNKDVEYTGVGIGSNNENLINFDLESGPLPFSNQQFHSVLCLDVLEHVENIHQTFDELLRVSSQYVIISLPNVYASLWDLFMFGRYNEKKLIKFYGLSKERETDRHKWFFSPSEATEFIEYRAELQKFKVLQFDSQKITRGRKRDFYSFIIRKLMGEHSNLIDFDTRTLWWVLARQTQ